MILNLTQHKPSKEQLEEGVVDLPEPYLQEMRNLLTFEDLPDMGEICGRASKLVDMAANFFGKYETSLYEGKVMVGGAVFLMPTLVQYLEYAGFKVLYSFSKRMSVESTKPDGTVEKVIQFRHMGFVK